MKYASEGLKDEHSGILVGLAILGKMADGLASGKEEGILFPLGDRAIPAGIQSEMLEAFEKSEETAMGPGMHERLHGMLDAFSVKCLSAGKAD